MRGIAIYLFFSFLLPGPLVMAREPLPLHPPLPIEEELLAPPSGSVTVSPRFTDNGNGTITDNLTGLMWLKDANCIKTNYPGFDQDGTDGDGEVTWQHALAFVARINAGTYPKCGAGYTDWRLPAVNELKSLVNAEQAKQANLATWLNSQGFINVQADLYLSSTTFFSHTGRAWVVYMWNGDGSNGSKASEYYVWPVRAGR